MDGRIDGWMDGLMVHGWMDGWMDGMREWIHLSLYSYHHLFIITYLSSSPSSLSFICIISSSDNFGYSLCKVGHFYSTDARVRDDDGDAVGSDDDGAAINSDDLMVGAPGNSLMSGT